MDLKPFMSNVNSWRKHFKDTVSKGYDVNKKFHVIQEGSGFPTGNIISLSPAKQTEDIAKSEIIEINRSAGGKRKYKYRKGNKKVVKKKKLSHKKKRVNV